MPNRGLTQSVDMVRGRHGKTALDYHPIAFPCGRVTRSAVNIESFPSALEDWARDRKRKLHYEIRSDFSRMKRFVFIQLPAGDRKQRQRTRRHLIIPKKIT